MSQFDVKQETMVEVQNILQDMVAHLLLNKPDEPVPHMIQFMQEKLKVGAHPLTKDERIELDSLRLEHQKLLERIKQKPDMKNENSDDEDDEENEKKSHGSSSDSECDDEYLDVMNEPMSPLKQQQQVQMAQKSRTSVSAEVFGKYHVKQAFKPRVIEKTQEVKEKIKARLLTAFMFMGLDEKDLNIVIDAMDQRKCSPGEMVITEGEAGDVLYVVENGTLACSKILKGTDTFLKNFGPGDVFGELALLYNAPRAASIKADSESLLWELDRNTFNNIVKEASRKKREKFENFLQTVPILQNMDHYERSKLADAIKETKASTGEVIIKQGDQGDQFYILVEGQASVFLDADKDTSVMKYMPGDYFGELALLRNEPRAANVKASVDCKLITLDRKSFKRLLGPLDQILKRNMGTYQNYQK